MIAAAAANTSSSGLLAELASNTVVVNTKLQQVTEQISSGLVSDTYGGLGSGALTSLDLRPQIALNDAVAGGITAATAQMGVTQTVLTQISSLAQGVYTALSANAGSDSSGIDGIASQARDALGSIASLLNTRDGDAYIFAGQDSTNPPVPDPNNIQTSAFFTSIQAAVGGLGTNGVQATKTALDAAASPLPPTAAGQTSVQSVDTGDGTTVPYGMLANAPSLRQMMTSLAAIGSLSGTQGSAAGYSTFVQGLATQLGGASTGLTGEMGTLGEQQDALSATGTAIASSQISLKSQLSGVEDADVASLATTQSLLQTQLETSYKLIANMQNLSLVSYL